MKTWHIVVLIAAVFVGLYLYRSEKQAYLSYLQQGRGSQEFWQSRFYTPVIRLLGFRV